MAKTSLKARLMLYHKGKILLLKQKKKQGGNFTLVGGTVERKESPEEALIREVEEEAGIVLKKEDLQLAHVLYKRIGKDRRITLYFKAQKWAGTFRNKEPEKFKGVSWFSLDHLPENLTKTARHVLRQYRQGAFYSEF